MKRKELVDLSFELNNFLLSEHLIQSEKPNTALFCIGKACIIYIRRFIYTIFLNVYSIECVPLFGTYFP